MSDDNSNQTLVSETGDPLVGTTIQGRYRVEKKLGQGGMGAVYLAEHIIIQKKVAIKCLHAGLASNADVVRRFHNEAVAATAIGHPNIVDVTDMGSFDDGTFFMALEYLSGRDWQDDLDKSGPQPLHKVAHIGMQICDALEAASAKGIVHRDLKPENIFLIERHGDGDFVKVLDFGISKFHDGIGGSTKTGELMGTPYYMAPEQVRGEKDINHVADIYALGVIFYQALTGVVPFDGNTLPELILKIASQKAPKLESELPNVPQQIVKLVDRMLEKDQNARPQTFMEVADVLAEHLSPTSRLSRASRQDYGFSETALGGTSDEPSRGAPIPTQGSKPTPVGARGPDTEAGGTPGLFGHPDGATGEAALQDKKDHASTTSPHSITNPRIEHAVAQTPAPSVPKSALIAAAVLLTAGVGWFFSQNPDPVPLEPAAEESVNSNIVRVQISTLPPDAELLLDGEPLSNPFDGELEKDGKSHEITVHRDGFLEKKRKMVLSAAQRIFIQMTPANSDIPAPQADDKEPVTSPKPRVRPRVAPQPTQAPKPISPPAPAPRSVPKPAPAPQPASDLKDIF